MADRTGMRILFYTWILTMKTINDELVIKQAMSIDGYREHTQDDLSHSDIIPESGRWICSAFDRRLRSRHWNCYRHNQEKASGNLNNHKHPAKVMKSHSASAYHITIRTFLFHKWTPGQGWQVMYEIKKQKLKLKPQNKIYSWKELMQKADAAPAARRSRY